MPDKARRWLTSSPRDRSKARPTSAGFVSVPVQRPSPRHLGDAGAPIDAQDLRVAALGRPAEVHEVAVDAQVVGADDHAHNVYTWLATES